MSDYWPMSLITTAITATDILDPRAARRKLERRARTYRVLNRNAWWNRRFVTIAAANDFEAVHLLTT